MSTLRAEATHDPIFENVATLERGTRSDWIKRIETSAREAGNLVADSDSAADAFAEQLESGGLAQIKWYTVGIDKIYRIWCDIAAVDDDAAEARVLEVFQDSKQGDRYESAGTFKYRSQGDASYDTDSIALVEELDEEDYPE